MNWGVFWGTAFLSSIILFVFYFLAEKHPEKIACAISSIMPLFTKICICAFCAWVAVGYMVSYIDICLEITDGIQLTIAQIAILIIYGASLTFLMSQIKAKDGNVITFDICIALCADIIFFWHFGAYETVAFLVALILGKFFWFDNIDLRPKAFCNAMGKIWETIKQQGVVTTVIYGLILCFLFHIAMNVQIQFKAETQLGICFGIPTGIVPLCLFLYIRERCRKGKTINGVTKEEIDQSASENLAKGEKR